MKKSTYNKYDYANATELDNIAYDLYLKKNKCDLYYTQMGFVGSVGCEKYYKEANIILRKIKLKQIDTKRNKNIKRSI